MLGHDHDPIINSNFSLEEKQAPVGRRLFRKRVPKILGTRKCEGWIEETHLSG